MTFIFRIFIVEIYTTVKYTQKWIDYGHLAFNFDLQMMSPKADARVLDETVKTWKGVISTYAVCFLNIRFLIEWC